MILEYINMKDDRYAMSVEMLGDRLRSFESIQKNYKDCLINHFFN